MRVALLILAIAAIVSDSPLSAHHSYSAYETDRIMHVEGVLEEFEWVAPHSLLKVKDDEGRLYLFEWQAPLSLQRRGIQQDTLKTGDRIVVTGNPHREFVRNRILNFRSVRRASDGWKWPSS
jgi:Family of unknown function (DUF6152)